MKFKNLIYLALISLIIYGCGSGGDSNAIDDNNIISYPLYDITAKCVDGSYSTSSICPDTCLGHGGVTQWFRYLIPCGDGMQTPITANDIPTIEITNVQPTNIRVKTEMPYNQNITFGISASDRAGVKNVDCGLYKSSGDYILGSNWNFSPSISSNHNVNKPVKIGINAVTVEVLTLKCKVTDISANTAIATRTITVN